MIYTHVAAALLAALAAWFFQDARMDAAVAEVRLEQTNERLGAVSQARADERAITKNYQEAINDARIREAALRRDLAAAGAESDGLRAQLAGGARRIADAPPAAVAEYTTAISELFADCSRSYQELAGKADGHASDVRTLREAWPMTGSATHGRHQD